MSDLPVKTIRVYPNPASGGFFLDYPFFNGKEVTVSLFTTDGRLAYHKSISSFSARQAIQPGKKLSSHYLAIIRQGQQVYSSRILFTD